MPQSSYSVSPGKTTTLECFVTSSLPLIGVYWKQKGRYGTITIEFTTNANKYSGTTTITPSLTIFNAGQRDVGTYTCFAMNGIGTGQSSTTALSISGSIPTVSVPQSSYSVSPGKTVTLECFVNSSLPLINVYWTRRGRYGTITIKFTTNANKYSGTTTITPSLTIFNAEQRDVGTYICFAENGVGTGQSLTTVLVVTGIYWQRNIGGDIKQITFSTNTNKYSGSTKTTPSLTIFNATQSDAGTYTCFAINSVGPGHSASTTLTVTGTYRSSGTLRTFSNDMEEVNENVLNDLILSCEMDLHVVDNTAACESFL
ncbi:Hypothetical predicted protein [Mytilus galloprovincialis]|uniref:Ig-like domain-containing protein n=1 Tax=Mytilus galloprovincialis TaxID=29158 RepID=A0A8B6D2U4_MYTGA|nr:Hypothetical predicted protein [Mytilus galloprovincialis]